MTTSTAQANVAKLRGYGFLSVTQFAGCDPTGATSSLAAFSSAYAAASAGERIQIPPGTYQGVTSVLTGTKFVVWEADGTSVEGANGTWTLPGLVVQGLSYTGSGMIYSQRNVTTGTDPGNEIFERITSHSGGTPGYTVQAVQAYTKAGAGVTNYEWTMLSMLDNYATAGQNVAFYGQSNVFGTGPTWAGVLEMTDKTGNANPAGGRVGLEVKMSANGADGNTNRVGIDVVGATYSTGSMPTFSNGIRIGPSNGVSSQCSYTNGMLMSGNMTNGLVISANTTTGVSMTGTASVGIDMSTGVKTVGVRLASGTPVSFDASDVHQLVYVTGTVSGLSYNVSGVQKVILEDNGGIILTNPIAISGGFSASSATAGSASALPGVPVGYLTIYIAGSAQKIPYWNP